MDETIETEAAPEAMLEKGYGDLAAGKWEQADAQFREILEHSPGDGLACLGRAMAGYHIHGREELAENWTRLIQEPEFQAELRQAKADFLPWLQKDMEQAGAGEQEEQPIEEFQKRFARLKPEKKVYYGSLMSQVILYLLVAFFIGKGTGQPDNRSAAMAADLMIAAVVSGLPMILSGFYGRSILRNGIFCRVLQILNNIAAVLGSLFCMIMVAAGMTAVGGDPAQARSDQFFCFAFMAAFLNYFLALIVPMILKRVKGKTDGR